MAKRNQRIARQLAEARIVKGLLRKLLKQPPVYFPRRREKLEAPDKHGVYIIFDKRDRILHVGRTLRGTRGLWQRLNNHLNGQSSFVETFLNGNKARLLKGYKYKFLQISLPRRRALLEHLATGMLCPAHLGTGQNAEL